MTHALVGFELIFRSQLEVCSQTCCVFLLMSSREGCLWSLLTAAYLCHVISCCFEPSACCFVLCDVSTAAGKPSLLESHAKYFGCWSGIIDCWGGNGIIVKSWSVAYYDSMYNYFRVSTYFILSSASEWKWNHQKHFHDL